MFIILFWLGSDRLSGLLSFVPDLFFYILTPLFLSSSSVPLSYFSHAVPMRECLRKHSCMSSPFPTAVLNGTSSFLSLVQEHINMPSGHYYIGIVPEVAVKTIKFKNSHNSLSFVCSTQQQPLHTMSTDQLKLFIYSFSPELVASIFTIISSSLVCC